MYNTILQSAFSARRKGLGAFVGEMFIFYKCGAGNGAREGVCGCAIQIYRTPRKDGKNPPGGSWSAGGAGQWGRWREGAGGGGARQWGGVAGQGSGGEWGRKWQRMSGTPPRVTPSPAPQNSSPTSKQGQAFAANSLWPCTVALGNRRRSRSTSASSAMRCEGVRVSFGEPSLASRPPM